MKFYGLVGYNQGMEQLDFCGNLDLGPDLGMFGRNFTIEILAMVKVSPTV